MPRNLEVKARVASSSSVVESATKIGARKLATIHQKDTYFAIPDGRLKLREIRGRRSELIYYERPGKRGTKGRWSSYLVYPVRNPGHLLRTLAGEFKVKCVVEKVRTVFLFRNARIHCDAVKGLGEFLEFEVIENRGRAQARALLNTLRRHFGLTVASTVAGSYEDLLAARLRRKR